MASIQPRGEPLVCMMTDPALFLSTVSADLSLLLDRLDSSGIDDGQRYCTRRVSFNNANRRNASIYLLFYILISACTDGNLTTQRICVAKLNSIRSVSSTERCCRLQIRNKIATINHIAGPSEADLAACGCSFALACAWMAVRHMVVTTSATVQPLLRSFTGFRRPCSMGPIARAPVDCKTSRANTH